MKDLDSIDKGAVALILDGFINGLGIARSLSSDPSVPIVLIVKKGSLAASTRYAAETLHYKTLEELNSLLIQMNRRFKNIVPFPGGDEMFRLLVRKRRELNNFSIPWQSEEILDKAYQHRIAYESGIFVPKSITISSKDDLSYCSSLSYPAIIKPLARPEMKRLFKAEITQDETKLRSLALSSLELGIPVIVSEYLEGEDSDLYTYAGYSYDGEILADYTGRKLAQVPHLRGVAGIAESQVNDEVRMAGAAFVKRIGFTGIFQVEMKKRDQKYYFIEFNARNWLWGHLATKDGCNLPLVRFNKEAHSRNTSRRSQQTPGSMFIWADSILYNLLKDRWTGSLKILLKNFARKKDYAVFSASDWKPFFASVRNSILFGLRIRKELH